MSKKFPKFASHGDAVCFCCGERLSGDAQDSGNAHGRGQFMQACAKTGMRTWYDIPNGHAHPIFQKICSGLYRPSNAELLQGERHDEKMAMFRAEY